ncbi:uncharacterized protein LOC135467565 [Liolophura sinensis]|uniref:uncharacterized protein LOC135467565 n=1 Tax=Liolophura sinensis TaxID=3198878 RepID=UPI0031593871
MGNGNAAKADTCNQPWTMENPCRMQLNETEKGPSHCDNISDKYEDGRIMEDSDTDNCLEGPNEESVDIDRTYMTVDEADCGTSFLCATMDETGECEPSGRMCFGPADNTSLTEESGLVVGGTADIEELEECEDDEKSADVAVISSEGSSPAQGVKTGIDTDPTIEDILASVDTDPTIGDRLASVDTDPTIEDILASVDTDPTIGDRLASVDTDPTIENRLASVDTDPTIEGRLACVGTDPTIGDRLASVDTDPTIENRLASVDTDPTIEGRLACVGTDPTIGDRLASVDTDPTIENRLASVDTDPTIEGRLACVDTDPTIEGRLACVGTDPTIENRLASVDSDPTIEDRMAAEPDSHQAELTTSAKRMVQQNIPRSPVFPAREKTPKPRRKWMWQTREICYESSDSDDDDVVSILAPSEASFLQEEGDLSQPFWNEDVTDMDAFNNDIPDLATSQTTPPLTHSKLTSDQSPFRDFKIPVKTTKAVMGPPAKVPKSPITLGAVQSVVMGKIVKKSLLGEKAKVPPQVCPPEFFNFPNCFPPNHCIEYLLNGECKAGTGCKFQKHTFISKNDGVKMAIKGIEAYQKGELKNALLAYRSLMLLDVAPPAEGIILSLLHHCCKQGAASEALAILTDICFGRYLRASMWTKLYQLFAEDKMKYREHISLLLKAMISFQLRPEHNCMLDILRCCMDGLLWEDLWKALTYCHEWFQVSLNMKTSALQALKNDPKHLLPLAAPWIKAQDVTSLTLIRKDLLRTLTSECHSLGLPICAQIFSKAFTASLDPRRDLASRYGKSALEGATDITCHEQISGLANSDSILSRIKGCGVTCNWLYLGELFVEVCQEEVNAFDPVLHKAFLDTLLKDQPAATTTTGYKTFVETALKAALTEDAQGCLNKEFLAKIGVELLAFFYSHNGWKHGMDILFALEENQLNSYLTMKLDDQAMDVSIMAVETALYKMHPSFAISILNRCFSGQICGAMFLSSSLPVKKFKHCLHLFRVLVDQLLNKNMREEILELMRVTLEKCPGLRDSLQETGDLASSTICRILNDKEVKIAEELFKLSCDYRLPVQPLVVRALLVGCSEVRWSTKVADLFTFCQRNIYSKQNVEELPRSVQIDALLSEVEMRLIIEDYLYQVYRILCDKRARQIPYDEGEFHLHIMVTSSIDPYTEHTYLPACRPNAVHRAKESLLSILHEHFKFQAHVAMPRVIRVSPESVQQYFIVLDGSRAAPQRPVPLHPVAPHPLPPHPAVPPIQGRVPMGRAHGEMAGYPGGVRPGRRRPRSLHPRGRGPGYIRPHEKPRYPPAGNN